MVGSGEQEEANNEQRTTNYEQRFASSPTQQANVNQNSKTPTLRQSPTCFACSLVASCRPYDTQTLDGTGRDVRWSGARVRDSAGLHAETEKNAWRVMGCEPHVR